MDNHKILVTGGAGSIGSELVRQLAPNNSVFILDINETAMFDLVEELKIGGRIGDVRDMATLEEVFQRFQPDVVFHASALKHVTPNEFNPLEAMKTNAIGTFNVVACAKKYSVETFVNISTDKVVNADSIMGITKKLAEKVVKNAGYVSVRFGNVLGSRGSVIPFWQRQMESGKPLTVTDERMTRFMMTIPEAVALVIKASEIGLPGQIMILDMGEPVNILELAKEILKKSGKDNGIEMIGIRPGETLTERLMTEEEEKTAQRIDNFFIL